MPDDVLEVARGNYMFPLRLASAKLSILKISGYHESLFPSALRPCCETNVESYSRGLFVSAISFCA
jgi:hypothetical protein